MSSVERCIIQNYQVRIHYDFIKIFIFSSLIILLCQNKMHSILQLLCIMNTTQYEFFCTVIIYVLCPSHISQTLTILVNFQKNVQHFYKEQLLENKQASVTTFSLSSGMVFCLILNYKLSNIRIYFGINLNRINSYNICLQDSKNNVLHKLKTVIVKTHIAISRNNNQSIQIFSSN